jgi:hypothetical protein
MSHTINGHTLTDREVRTLNCLQDYLRKYAGDTWASPSTSPKGDGRTVPLSEIFGTGPGRRSCVEICQWLQDLGVLRACEISLLNGGAKLVPFREQVRPTLF